MEIKINKNKLEINGKEITFTHNIRQFKTIGADIAVLLEIPNNDDSIDNIYCYDKNGMIKWRVQPIREAFPEMKRVYCYEQMNIKEGQISATDFYGRRFIIDPIDGRIVKKEIVK